MCQSRPRFHFTAPEREREEQIVSKIHFLTSSHRPQVILLLRIFWVSPFTHGSTAAAAARLQKDVALVLGVGPQRTFLSFLLSFNSNDSSDNQSKSLPQILAPFPAVNYVSCVPCERYVYPGFIFPSYEGTFYNMRVVCPAVQQSIPLLCFLFLFFRNRSFLLFLFILPNEKNLPKALFSYYLVYPPLTCYSLSHLFFFLLYFFLL